MYVCVEGRGGRGGGSAAAQKDPPNSFSPVTSTNVGISPQNFEQRLPFKKVVFLVKSSQNWGYDNFFYTNGRVTKL